MKQLVIAFLRLKYFILSSIAPNKAVDSALSLFFSPKKHSPKANEQAIKTVATSIILENGAVCYEWGKGKPVVFIHGWEGRATQVVAMLDTIVSAGFKLIAVDAPAHGDSKGTFSHPGLFVETLLQINDKYGELHAVIGHSMGGGCSVYAATKGLNTQKVISIAGPSNFFSIVNGFAEFIGLIGKAKQAFLDKTVELVKIPLIQININDFTHAQSLLVLHDQEDKEVSIEHTEAYQRATSRVELKISNGLGHRKILYSPETVEAVSRFLKA
jgi:hypothetical protein